MSNLWASSRIECLTYGLHFWISSNHQVFFSDNPSGMGNPRGRSSVCHETFHQEVNLLIVLGSRLFLFDKSMD